MINVHRQNIVMTWLVLAVMMALVNVRIVHIGKKPSAVCLILYLLINNRLNLKQVNSR